jgi:hypothetical protein
MSRKFTDENALAYYRKIVNDEAKKCFGNNEYRSQVFFLTALQQQWRQKSWDWPLPGFELLSEKKKKIIENKSKSFFNFFRCLEKIKQKLFALNTKMCGNFYR